MTLAYLFYQINAIFYVIERYAPLRLNSRVALNATSTLSKSGKMFHPILGFIIQLFVTCIINSDPWFQFNSIVVDY